MGLKSKITVCILFLIFLNLAFTLGQLFYYRREISKTHLAKNKIPAGTLSANLLRVVQQKFVLTTEGKELVVSQDDLKKWLEDYKRNFTNQKEYRINQGNIRKYLEVLSQSINIPPVDAKLDVSEGKITEFMTSQPGRSLNIQKTLSNIIAALTGNNSSDNNPWPKLEIDEIQPEVSIGRTNSLGIKSLLGQGESNFSGSSFSRAKNIEVSSKIFNGITLKPGEEFSFVSLLGPVDGSGGYQPELVIKKNKLIPEFGGGICQVSTTLFRAVMAAGLPIIERHPHSLPVRYYNPQGFDATVYPGVADLKFKNDTSAYILIQSKISGSKLNFEIYGTGDGRKITITGPHQYDIRADGSLKAELGRIVIYSDGTKKEDLFKSAYQSPSLFPTVQNPLE